MRLRVSHGYSIKGLAWLLVLGFGLAPPTIAWGADEAADQADADAYHHAKALSTAFRNAARKALPTVVTVETTTKPHEVYRGPKGRSPFQDTPLEGLLEDQVPGLGAPSPPQPTPNLGSGVIIDSSGIVLTNNHVVAGAKEVVVQLSDGRRFKATSVKVDDKSDLAVVRIDTQEKLPAATLGDSDKLEIGDWVLAIGNPYELERTVSAGIISAKGRSLGAIGRSNYLQTDAAINPGNSGGPLVNLEGQIVGINTAIFSRSGGNQGIGFAIPSNVARWVVPQLVANGEVRRSYLGVAIASPNGEQAARLGVRPKQGVVVERVFPDSPAAEAGLKEKDVLLSFDDASLENATDLQQAVERSQAASKHRLEILRDGQRSSVQVTLKAMPDQFGTVRPGPPGEGDPESAPFHRDRELGLIVANLTPQLANRLGVKEDAGVVVFRVQPQSIAAQAGVREGMLIVQVGQQPVKNVADFKAAMESQRLEEGITLQLQTREGTKTVTLSSS